jgi:hypothetical protein
MKQEAGGKKRAGLFARRPCRLVGIETYKYRKSSNAVPGAVNSGQENPTPVPVLQADPHQKESRMDQNPRLLARTVRGDSDSSQEL